MLLSMMYSRELIPEMGARIYYDMATAAGVGGRKSAAGGRSEGDLSLLDRVTTYST